MAIAPQHKTAVDFFLKQARKFWLKTDCRQTQATWPSPSIALTPLTHLTTQLLVTS